MPDPTRQTISATQMPVLFNASPWQTRWMMYHEFAGTVGERAPANSLMKWGLRMQPLVLQQAAEDLRLEIIPNDRDHYHRRGLFGCTRDATVICPDRGPGALEIKCCFNLQTWMQEWGGGEKVPRHYEIQLQDQIYVGDEEQPYEWGMIGVWFAAEMRYFERKPLPELWRAAEFEAEHFLADVRAGHEPDPFGEPVELPVLAKMFPVQEHKIVDLSTGEDAEKLAQMVADFEAFGAARKVAAKSEEALKAKVKAVIRDAEEARFAHGITIRQKQISRRGYEVKPSSYSTMDVYIPGERDDAPNILSAG